MNSAIFVISAPSGAGKTSLVESVLARKQSNVLLERVVTYTTKSPKPGELHGKDYYFISTSEFEQKIAEDFFIEWSNAYGHYYGSPRSMLAAREKGISSIIILDRTGAHNMLLRVPDAILIWIMPPSIDILEKRLLVRGRETPEQIKKRIELATQELAAEKKNSLFHYCVQNDDFVNASQKLEAIFNHHFHVSARAE